MRGFLDLAYRLGLVAAQWQPSGVEKCHLIYRGEVAAKNTKLLTSAFCAGLLERAFADDVNIVNAEMLLLERGIKLTTENRSDMGAFSSSITAEVVAGGQPFVASGTLFGNNMPRLVRLNEHRLEAYLDGTLLVFTHNDVPGIIGAVGTIFGEHTVNIAQMSVGRAQPGGGAIGVLNLDGVPPQAALDAVTSHKDIHSVKVLELPAAGNPPRWLQ